MPTKYYQKKRTKIKKKKTHKKETKQRKRNKNLSED